MTKSRVIRKATQSLPRLYEIHRLSTGTQNTYVTLSFTKIGQRKWKIRILIFAPNKITTGFHCSNIYLLIYFVENSP